MCNLDLQWILSFIGVVTIIGFILLCCMILWELATDTLRTLKWQYKYKHRFDKPPTAQCYCKDCKYFQIWEAYGDAGRCGRGHIENRTVSDNYFCWLAEPLKSDPELVKED